MEYKPGLFFPVPAVVSGKPADDAVAQEQLCLPAQSSAGLYACGGI